MQEKNESKKDKVKITLENSLLEEKSEWMIFLGKAIRSDTQYYMLYTRNSTKALQVKSMLDTRSLLGAAVAVKDATMRVVTNGQVKIFHVEIFTRNRQE